MRKLLLLQLLVINSFTNQVAKGQLDESCISGFLSDTEIISGGRECNSQTDEDSSEPSNNCFKERTSNGNGGYSTRIIPDLRVTCNGTLTGWRAAGEMTSRDTSPLFQIWRKIDGQQERYQREGDSIPLGSCNGRNEHQEISTNSRYYECILEASVSVRTGDIVGLVLPRERDTSFRLYFIDESVRNYVYRFHPLTVFPDPSQRGSRRERQDNGLPLITLMIDQDQTTTELTSTTNYPMIEEHTTAIQTTAESTTGESTTGEVTTGEATVEITSAESTIGEPTTVTVKPITGESTTAQSTTGEVTTGEATNLETTVEIFTTESTPGESTTVTAKTTTGEPTNVEATAGEATSWETTLEVTTMESTTGEPSNGQTTIAKALTGEQTTKELTTEIPTTGNAITGVPTTWKSTTAEPSTEEPTLNAEKPTTTQQTTGEATTVKPTTKESTTAKAFTEKSITSETSTVEPTTEQQSTAATIKHVQSTSMEPITKETTTVATIIAHTESITMEEPATAISTTGETTSGETRSRKLTTGQLHATTEQPTTMEPTTTDGQLITETSIVDTTTGELTTLEPTTAEIHASTVETTTSKRTTLQQTTRTTVISELTTTEPTVSPPATGESIATTKMPTTAKTFFKQIEVQPTNAIPSTGVTTIGQSVMTSVLTTSTKVLLTQVAEETPPSSTLKPTVVTKSKADSIHSIVPESRQLISASASDRAQCVKSTSAAIPSKLSSSLKLIIAEPMSTIAASNYHTMHTLTTTVQTSSIEPTSVNPTTVVKTQSTNTNPMAKPTAIKPQPTTLTNLNAEYTASISSTAVTPTGTELHVTSSATPVWHSIQDRSTVVEEQIIIVTMLDSSILVTASPDGLPSTNDTLDITYNTGIFFGDPENITATSVGGLLITVVVINLVVFFFILKRYRKKHAYSAQRRCPAYTNPITESINVAVNLGADNSGAASQPEQEQTSPGTNMNNIYTDLSKPPHYEQADRTYMHLYSEPSLPVKDTEYTIINTCTLEDSGYYEVPFNNNSQNA